MARMRRRKKKNRNDGDDGGFDWELLKPEEPQPGLLPRGGGFYGTTGERIDPRDCERWPDSPWCGGNPISALPVEVDLSLVADKCNFGVQYQGTFLFMKGSTYQMVYRRPGKCREDPPPEDEEDWDRGTSPPPKMKKPRGTRNLCHGRAYYFMNVDMRMTLPNGWIKRTATWTTIKPIYDWFEFSIWSNGRQVGVSRQGVMFLATRTIHTKRDYLHKGENEWQEHFAVTGFGGYADHLGYAIGLSPFSSEFRFARTTPIVSLENPIATSREYIRDNFWRPFWRYTYYQQRTLTLAPWGFPAKPYIVRTESPHLLSGAIEKTNELFRTNQAREHYDNKKWRAIGGREDFRFGTENREHIYYTKIAEAYPAQYGDDEGGSGKRPACAKCRINKPPPPMPRCCKPKRGENDDRLLKLLLKKIEKIEDTVGVEDFPAKLPKELFEDSNSSTKVESIPQMLAWFVEQVDGLVGQFPIEIEVEDTDLAKEGNQKLKFEIPNLAEGIAELLTLALSNKAVNEAQLVTEIDTLVETGENKQLLFKTYALLQATQEYLGFSTKQKTQKMPLSFSPGKEELDKFLKESKVKVRIEEFNDGRTLEQHLKFLLLAGSIIKAVFWQGLPSDQAGQKKHFQEVLDHLKEGDEEDFDDYTERAERGFIEEPGITDKANPYGNPYPQRPRIRDVGGDKK